VIKIKYEGRKMLEFLNVKLIKWLRKKNCNGKTEKKNLVWEILGPQFLRFVSRVVEDLFYKTEIINRNV